MIEQGDVVIANVPFSNFEDFKERPCLVVSNDTLNRSEDVILVAISSQPNEFHGIEIPTANVISGLSSIQGYVHAHKILRVHKSLITRIIASLSTSLIDSVLQKIHDYLKRK